MNWWTKAKTFLTETKAEMSKVTFPSREEVAATTIVVLVASFIFAIFLAASDWVINNLYQAIFNLFA